MGESVRRGAHLKRQGLACFLRVKPKGSHQTMFSLNGDGVVMGVDAIQARGDDIVVRVELAGADSFARHVMAQSCRVEGGVLQLFDASGCFMLLPPGQWGVVELYDAKARTALTGRC